MKYIKDIAIVDEIYQRYRKGGLTEQMDASLSTKTKQPKKLLNENYLR